MYFVPSCVLSVSFLSDVSKSTDTKWKSNTSASRRSSERFLTAVPRTGPASTRFQVFIERFVYVRVSVENHFLFSTHLRESAHIFLPFSQESPEPQQRLVLAALDTSSQFGNFHRFYFSWLGHLRDRQRSDRARIITQMGNRNVSVMFS